MRAAAPARLPSEPGRMTTEAPGPRLSTLVVMVMVVGRGSGGACSLYSAARAAGLQTGRRRPVTLWGDC